MDRSADRDVKIKLQFVRGQLEKGRIIQVYVMDTGRIGALTSPQYFSHAMRNLLSSRCLCRDGLEGTSCLEHHGPHQGGRDRFGHCRRRARCHVALGGPVSSTPSSLFHILASRCKEATRQRRRWTSRHGRTLLDVHSSDRLVVG